MNRTVVNLGLVGVSLFFCVLAFEVYLRVTGYVRGYSDPTIYRVSESGSRHELTPGWSGMHSGASVRINSLGLRGPEVPSGKARQEFRILLVGDSVLFGLGVEEPYVLSAQLKRMLQTIRPKHFIRVINAGVPAYNTPAELEQLRGLLHLRPDMLIVVYTADNDSDMNLGFQIDHTRNQVLDSAVNPSLPGQISLWMHRHISAYNFIRTRIRILTYRQRMEPPVSAQEAFAERNAGWQRSRAAIKEMQAIAREVEIPIMVAGIGIVQRLPGLDVLEAFCRQHGINYVEVWRTTDLSDYFRRYAVSALDPHPNAEGLRVMAERLIVAIQPFIPE